MNEPKVMLDGGQVKYVFEGKRSWHVVAVLSDKVEPVCYVMVSTEKKEPHKTIIRYGNANQIDNLLYACGKHLFTKLLEERNGN